MSIKTPDSRGNKPEKHTITRRMLLKSGLVTMMGAGISQLSQPAWAQNPLGFCPNMGSLGDLITAFGPDLGSNPADISAMIVSGSSHAFTRPMSFNGGDLSTVITAIPPAMLSGQLQVSLGMGSHSYPSNLPSELYINEPIRSWVNFSGPRYSSYQSFQFPTASSQHCTSWWGGVQGGNLSTELILPYDANGCPICPPGTTLVMRFRGATPGHAFECEYQAALITTTSLYAEHIADAMGTVMQSAFNSDLGVNMNWSMNVLSDSHVSLAVGSPDGSPFIKGAINVAVYHTPGSSDCDSINSDSTDPDSMSGDSMACDSIDVDFLPFIFS